MNVKIRVSSQGNRRYIDGLLQDCSISSALAMEILQSCTKSPTYKWMPLSAALGNILQTFNDLLMLIVLRELSVNEV